MRLQWGVWRSLIRYALQPTPMWSQDSTTIRKEFLADLWRRRKAKDSTIVWIGVFGSSSLGTDQKWFVQDALFPGRCKLRFSMVALALNSCM
mmetsp:Transcript_13455/g.29493  ORF Transcript_13455/g.29493 Transcript_13455/m.29493 type:complete len:92 (+) Transcript_13455:2-277(+)